MLANVLGRAPTDLDGYYLYRAELIEELQIVDRRVIRAIFDNNNPVRRVNEITRNALETELIALDEMVKAGAFDTPTKRVIGIYP